MIAVLLVLFGMMWASAAQAQNCGVATAQGTAPANWQTYCWLNFADYDDAAARSAAGQNLSFALPDGSVLSFNARVTGGSGTAYNSVAAPSWSGAAVGNSAFIGIPGRPVLYTAAAGTRTITLSGITVRPPVGTSASLYSFIVADAESSNQGESLRMATNGGAWQLLDSVPPISGTRFPALAGVGSSNVDITGVAGTVGGYILSSDSPTSVTVETVAGGLQGVMFAVRFASIRLQNAIIGARNDPADQFQFQIVSSLTNAVIASGMTTGGGNGPFSTPPVVMAAGIPLTLRATMAPGSAGSLGLYSSSLTCVNTAGPTRPSLPDAIVTTNFSLGALEFGEALVCTFTTGSLPQLRLRKALGTSRRFNTDQFTVRITQGETVIAASTTTGSSTTVNAGDTGMVALESGQAYALDEVGAGATNLGNYDATLACSNAVGTSTTTLPTMIGGSVTAQPGDRITCVITNSRVTTAVLTVEKSSLVISDPINGTVNPKAVPGAIIEYAITVTNVGARAVDTGSLVILDILPPGMSYAVISPVVFVDGPTSSGLGSFDPATMVTYSAQADGSGPYSYTPSGPFDTAVRAIRIAPGGRMQRATSATNQPSFSIRFRAQVE